MADTTGQQLIEKALTSVEDRVQQQIQAARTRRDREREQRAQLAAARTAGLARRHATRLRNQANRGDIDTVAGSPEDPANDRGPARTPVPDSPSTSSDRSQHRRARTRVHAHGEINE